MSRELLFGLAGALLVFITLLVALRAIFAGNFKPHRVTYGIFVVINLVTFVNQVVNRGGYSAYFLGVSFVAVTLIFGLSFKYGMGGATKLDRVTLIAADLLAIYWITLQESRISTVLAIVIDIVALIPTIHKAFKNPETEIYLNWMISGVGGLLSIFANTESDWILYIFPIYIFIANFLVVLAKYFGHLKQRKVIPSTS